MRYISVGAVIFLYITTQISHKQSMKPYGLYNFFFIAYKRHSPKKNLWANLINKTYSTFISKIIIVHLSWTTFNIIMHKIIDSPTIASGYKINLVTDRYHKNCVLYSKWWQGKQSSTH